MKNKIDFKSNAKLKENITADDIGKLSINDVKKLKEILGPKPRTKTNNNKRKAESMIDEILGGGGIKSSSDHMKGWSSKLDRGDGKPPVPPVNFNRGYVPQGGQFLISENPKQDETRFATKSHLNDKIDDGLKSLNDNFKTLEDSLTTRFDDRLNNNLIDFGNQMNSRFNNNLIDFGDQFNTRFNNNINPLLENIRNDNMLMLNSSIQPQFNDLNNKIRQGYNMFFDYQKNNKKLYENIDDDKTVYEDIDDDPSTNLFDDSGNFGGSLGDDYFVSNDAKVDDVLSIPDELNNIPRRKTDNTSQNQDDGDLTIFEKQQEVIPIQDDEEGTEPPRTELREIYRNLGGNDSAILESSNVNVIQNAINDLMNNKSTMSVDSLEEDPNEEPEINKSYEEFLNEYNIDKKIPYRAQKEQLMKIKKYSDTVKALKRKYKNDGGTDDWTDEFDVDHIKDAIKDIKYQNPVKPTKEQTQKLNTKIETNNQELNKKIQIDNEELDKQNKVAKKQYEKLMLKQNPLYKKFTNDTNKMTAPEYKQLYKAIGGNPDEIVGNGRSQPITNVARTKIKQKLESEFGIKDLVLTTNTRKSQLKNYKTKSKKSKK